MKVTFDGQPVEFGVEMVGNDRYLVLSGPGGQHGVETVKGSTTTQPETAPTVTRDAFEPSVSQETWLTEVPTLLPVATMSPIGIGAREDGTAQELAGSDRPGISKLGAVITIISDAGGAAVLEAVQSVSTGLVVLSSLGLIVLILVRSRQR